MKRLGQLSRHGSRNRTGKCRRRRRRDRRGRRLIGALGRDGLALRADLHGCGRGFGILGRRCRRSGFGTGRGRNRIGGRMVGRSGRQSGKRFLRDTFKNVLNLVGGIVGDGLLESFTLKLLFVSGGVLAVVMKSTGNGCRSKKGVSRQEHSRLQRFQFKTLLWLSLLVVHGPNLSPVGSRQGKVLIRAMVVSAKFRAVNELLTKSE